MISYFRKYKKTALFLIILICAFVFYKLGTTAFHSPAPDVKVVEVEKIQLKDIHKTAQFIGTVKAQRATTLTAKSDGILDKLAVSGQNIKKGERIAQIDNPDIERNYKLAEEAEKIAKQQYDRLNQLLNSGAVSKQLVEEKENVWIEYQKKLSDAKIALDEINITAPFDGIVGVFKVREGSQVQKNDNIVNFYDPSSMIVEFDVPLSILKNIQDGSPVFINQQRYSLTHIQKMLDEDTHMSPAYVKIQCPACIIGATVDVQLVVDQKKSVVVIPYEAVFLRNGKTFTYVVKEGKAELSPVQLGLREKKYVEITSGLKPNDRVIVTGAGRLFPGMPVIADKTS